MQLQTTADEELGVLMITVTGCVDEHSALALRRAFDTATAAGHVRVVADLTALDDVDTAVAATFLELDEMLTARGGWLWLVHGATELGSALRSAGVVPQVRPSRHLAVGGS